MTFRVVPLAAEQFKDLNGLSDEALALRGIVSCVADRQPGYPCRVSLRDAGVGARMFLLNYEHQPVHSPYRSTHAIYVQQGATSWHPDVNTVPDVLRTRLLSVRAFNAAGIITDADVVDGHDAAACFERMLSDTDVAYLHVHNAKRGCYAARVDRVSMAT